MVPKLRFKEFCGEWEEKRLKDYFIKITDKNRDKKIKNVISNSAKFGLVQQEEYFLKDIANKDNIDTYYIIEKNDFVYNPRKSIESPYGPINIYTLDEKGVVSPLYSCFRLIKEADHDYYRYFFKADKWYRYIYMVGDSGARHDRVSIRDAEFFNMNISVPSLPEQTKIADFLSTVDDKIQNQQDKITHLENIKKGFMQKIFSRKIRFKDDGGEEFPEWEDNILKNYIEIITGYPFDSEKFIEENNNNPIIRIRDLQDNKISLFTTENYDLKYKVYKGDILIGMDGDFYITMWKGIEVGLNQRIMKIRPKKGLIKNNFLYYLLIPLIKHINDITPFTTVKHLSSKDILNLKVKLPCLKEQQKIADFLSSFDEKIYTEKEVLEHLKQLKKGLLQQMFV